MENKDSVDNVDSTEQDVDESSDVSMSSDIDTDTDSDSGSGSASENNSIEKPTENQPTEAVVLKGNGSEEEEEEDEVVKAIREELNKKREHPPDIKSEDYIEDLSFHPVNDIIAAATITGDVILHKYTNESTEIISTLELHTKACRDIEFSDDGNILFSSSKDQSIMLSDVNTGKLKQLYDNAHDEPVNCILVMDNNLLASGDDSGTVKLWDIRKKDALFSLKEMDDYVSNMITSQVQRYLVCSSGDGTITSIDLRKRKLHIQSEVYDHELTCLATMINGNTLVVGSGKGALYFFKWGQFGYHSDEYPGPKETINCLLPITRNIAVYAGESGVIRAVHLFPHRHLGVVGQHQFGIESLDISCNGEFIASCSLDETIKFWNIQYFEDFELGKKKKHKKKDKMKEINFNLPSSKQTNVSDFFSGLL